MVSAEGMGKEIVQKTTTHKPQAHPTQPKREVL
jgi:hypothetical protein